mgnify:CR=1 FL=1
MCSLKWRFKCDFNLPLNGQCGHGNVLSSACIKKCLWKMIIMIIMVSPHSTGLSRIRKKFSLTFLLSCLFLRSMDIPDIEIISVLCERDCDFLNLLNLLPNIYTLDPRKFACKKIKSSIDTTRKKKFRKKRRWKSFFFY